MQKKLIATLLCSLAGMTQANDLVDWLNQKTEDYMTISGFGTVGAVKTNTKEAEFITSPKQVSGAKNKWDGSLDTSIGIQAKIKPFQTSPLSVTVQGLSKKRDDGDFRMRTEWAYAQYDLTDELSFRGGKLAVPIFNLSDFRNVGYAQLSVRPPLDVYGLVPVSQYNGGEMLYKHDTGRGNITIQPFMGSHRDFIPYGSEKIEYKGKQLLGMNMAWEYNGLTLRAVHLKTKMTDNNNVSAIQLFNLINALGRTDVTDRYALHNKQVLFSGVGLNYENKWINFQSEYTRRNARGAWLGTMDAKYMQLGIKLNQVTPYVGLSAATPKTGTESNDFDNSSPFSLAAQAGLNSLFKAGAVDQRTTTAGIRYDFHENMAVKTQFDRTYVRNGADGYFTQRDVDFNNQSKYYNIYNVTVDYVF